MWKLSEIQVSTKSNWNTAMLIPLGLICGRLVATPVELSSSNTTETQVGKLQCLWIWPFTENVCHPLA